MATSLAEQAYQGLLTAISDGRLKPGQAIRETALAEELGISRTPIREALQRLARDGLVRLDARNGARVGELSLQEIRELYDLRELLEGSVARFAALNARELERQRLEAILAREAERLDNPVALAALNKQFHRTLCEAASNRYLTSAVAAFSTTLLLLGPTTLAASHRAGESHDEHRLVVDAIAAGDADRAEHIMRAHIRRAREIRLSMVLEAGLAV